MSPRSTLPTEIVRPSLATRLTGRLFYPTAILFIVASVLAFYFIFWKTWRSDEPVEAGVSATVMAEEVSAAKLRLAILKQHEAQLKAVPESDLVRMSIALPKGPTTPELIVQLEALMLESGMLEADFGVDLGGQAAVAGADSKVQQRTGSFKFTASSYEQYKAIIEIVQKNLRLLDITTTSYDPATGASAIGFVTYFIP